MLPHEWLLTATGYMKTDALDHHDDHFLPGCQNIAWDVACASVEFELDDSTSAELAVAVGWDRAVRLLQRAGVRSDRREPQCGPVRRA